MRPLAHALFILDKCILAWTRILRGLTKATHSMATMYAVAARNRTSSQVTHIQHGAYAHALSNPIQKVLSVLRLCRSYLCATAFRSVTSVAIMESDSDRTCQDYCDTYSHSRLRTKPRMVPILYRRIAGPSILSWRPGTGTECIFTAATTVVKHSSIPYRMQTSWKRIQ